MSDTYTFFVQLFSTHEYGFENSGHFLRPERVGNRLNSEVKKQRASGDGIAGEKARGRPETCRSLADGGV